MTRNNNLYMNDIVIEGEWVSALRERLALYEDACNSIRQCVLQSDKDLPAHYSIDGHIMTGPEARQEAVNWMDEMGGTGTDDRIAVIVASDNTKFAIDHFNIASKSVSSYYTRLRKMIREKGCSDAKASVVARQALATAGYPHANIVRVRRLIHHVPGCITKISFDFSNNKPIVERKKLLDAINELAGLEELANEERRSALMVEQSRLSTQMSLQTPVAFVRTSTAHMSKFRARYIDVGNVMATTTGYASLPVFCDRFSDHATEELGGSNGRSGMKTRPKTRSDTPVSTFLPDGWFFYNDQPAAMHSDKHEPKRVHPKKFIITPNVYLTIKKEKRGKRIPYIVVKHNGVRQMTRIVDGQMHNAWTLAGQKQLGRDFKHKEWADSEPSQVDVNAWVRGI